MNALQHAITQAKITQDNTAINKAYLEFIKANFLIPIDKASAEDAPEVIFLEENDIVFLPVFSSKVIFDYWAFEIKEHINLLTLSGIDLLKGVGDEVVVSLDIGTDSYTAFYPAELARMRSMILKLFR